MSKSFHFEKERLKPILSLYISTGCNYEEHFPATYKKPLTLYFHDLIPMVQLGDGFHFIEAVFLKEAVNNFRKNYSHLKMSSMTNRLVKLTKWSL
jgi:hypothetical protein